jgi:rSAM/selenodomain-associated transferase 2
VRLLNNIWNGFFSETMKVSIIIPVLNEASHIAGTLQCLQPYRSQGNEVIVVDGGSRDDTVSCAKKLCDQVVSSKCGRAQQMNAGAKYANGDILIFLHADTILPDNACDLVYGALSHGNMWGRFDVRLSGSNWMFRIIERMMNLRSCLTSIATGDQAIFVLKNLFVDVGGYPEVRLMEDVALCKSLRKHKNPVCLNSRVVTSSRKWEKSGIVQTVFLMWRLRLLYFFGVSPDKLARYYYR